MRIGIGYDIHRLEKVDKPSYIPVGGVYIPCGYKVIAHSDGDVLLHAIIDACLGSLALGDIGTWFSDSSPENKGKSSKEFAFKVYDFIKTKGWYVTQIDSIIFLQSPKLAPYVPEIVNSIALIFSIDKSLISVKAKTFEGLGLIGNNLAISSSALIQVEKNA